MANQNRDTGTRRRHQATHPQEILFGPSPRVQCGIRVPIFYAKRDLSVHTAYKYTMLDVTRQVQLGSQLTIMLHNSSDLAPLCTLRRAGQARYLRYAMNRR